MKKLLFTAVVMMVTLTASAQHATGSFALKPTIGLNLSNFSGSELSTSMRAGLAVGVEAEYQTTPFLGISAGFLYSMQGAKLNVNPWGVKLGKVAAKVDYLNFPILANVYVTQGLALKAGLQIGVNMSSDIDIETSFLKDNIKVADVTDQTSSIDFSIPVGVSYEYQNFVIDARYNIGLSDVYKKDNTITTFALKGIKNSNIMITLGYKFDL